MPKVSVGLAMFNEAKYIAATIACLKAQTLSDFEVIVADNGSTDGTFDICKAAIDGDARFKLTRHPANIGAAFNFDYVYKCATADYFMWIGAHDLISETALKDLSDVLDTDPSASMSMAKPRTIDENGNDKGERTTAIYHFTGNEVSRYIQSVERLYDCTIFHSMFRRTILYNVPIPATVSYDHILISRMLWNGHLRYVASAAYQRRDFEHRTSGYAERIAGANAQVSRRDFSRAYIEDFLRLFPKGGSKSRNLAGWITDILVRRFGSSCLGENETERKKSELAYLYARHKIYGRHRLRWKRKKILSNI